SLPGAHAPQARDEAQRPDPMRPETQLFLDQGQAMLGRSSARHRRRCPSPIDRVGSGHRPEIREEATPRSSVPRTLSRVAPHLRPGSWRCTYSAEPHWHVTVMTYLDPRLRSAVEGIVALVRPEA